MKPRFDCIDKKYLFRTDNALLWPLERHVYGLFEIELSLMMAHSASQTRKASKLYPKIDAVRGCD